MGKPFVYIIVILSGFLGIVFPLQLPLSAYATGVISLMVFILGVFFPSILHFGSLYEKPQIVIPKLKDPISGKRPMTIYLWLNMGITFSAVGFIIGGVLQHHTFNNFGLILLALSLGFALGCGIMVKRYKNKQVIE